MKFIHFSDFHFGVEKGPIDKESRIPERILDYIDVLDSMIEFAEDEDVDFVIFSGDAFHTHNPNQTYLNLFAKSIERLARHCTIIMVVGNHDMPGPTHKSSSLDIFGNLKAENIIIGNRPKVHTLKTNTGDVQIAVLPYPMKQWIADGIDAPMNEIKVNVEIENIIDNLGKEIDEELPSILAAHLTVSSARFASGQTLVIGESNSVVNIESLLWPWDYVALGHIHIHQVLCEEPPVIYAGSLERVDFGDEGHAKGFVLVNIDNDGVDWEFIEADAREYVTISIDLSNVERGYMRKALNEISKHDVKDAVVRVIIKVSEIGNVLNTAEIEDTLMDAGAFYVQHIHLKSDVIISTPRLDLDEPIATYSPVELLDIYFDEQDMDDDEIDDVLDIAEEIMKEVEDD